MQTPSFDPLDGNVNFALDTPSSSEASFYTARASPVYNQQGLNDLELNIAPDRYQAWPNSSVANHPALQSYPPAVPKRFSFYLPPPPQQSEHQLRYFDKPHARMQQDGLPNPNRSTTDINHDESQGEQHDTKEQEAARPKHMGACVRCKGFKVRCVLENDNDTCKRCANAGVECVFPGRNHHRVPPKREHLLSQIREQAKQIQELMAIIEALKSSATAQSSESPGPTMQSPMPKPMGCARCKSLNVDCILENDSDTCERCANAGVECVIPPEHQLSQVREQAMQIQELTATVEALNSPAQSSRSPGTTIYSLRESNSKSLVSNAERQGWFSNPQHKHQEEKGVQPQDQMNGGLHGDGPVDGGDELFDLGSSLIITGSDGSLAVADDQLNNGTREFQSVPVREPWRQSTQRYRQFSGRPRLDCDEGAAMDVEDDVNDFHLTSEMGPVVDMSTFPPTMANQPTSDEGMGKLSMENILSNGFWDSVLVPGYSIFGAGGSGLITPDWLPLLLPSEHNTPPGDVKGDDGGDKEDEDNNQEVVTEEQNTEEGKWMISINAPDMYELSAVQADDGNVAQRHQHQLLCELEDKSKLTKEQKAKKRMRDQENGGKKKKQKLVNEEEQTPKTAEKAAEEVAMEIKQAHEEMHNVEEEEGARREATCKTAEEEKRHEVEEHIWSMFPGDLSADISREGEFPVAAGGYADIYQGTLRVPPIAIKVALKVIKVYSAEDNHLQKAKRLRREIKVWMKLNHTNVLSLFGTASGFGPFPAMVCPWLENGTLTSYLERCGADLEIHQILALIHDVASGLRYLHSQSIVHGDLSGSNVLVCTNGGACIADFGLSTVLDEIGSTFATTTGKPRGTLRWAAPELLDLVDNEDLKTRHSGPTIQSDIYSFGGIMLQTLSGKVPYHYYSRDVQIIAAIFRGETPTRPDNLRVTDCRWEFIQRCWSPFRNVVQRPSSEEIVAFSVDDLKENSL